ncbi:pentapeptide repeat-containing protein [Paracoccus fistulariae]|uniref:Pentapeptide repeat-containing protein n=3 Tax=Paracoccus fistulariae TaxID=658446 RepID=A0ABY7SQB3_9RHOB|nr:pentapeptide repeat-containing protein [Paracoccus fistulariae]WCR08256.1 pentapeptide repeat-containing protein [Paracoccus fistulariae]
MEARLQGAVLMAARLQGAHLEGARLEGANLMEARLQGADLEEARLDRSTDLRGADFSGSPLRSVDLSTVRISQDQVNASFGDGSVTLPPTIDRPAHWPEGKLHPREFYRQWRLWQSGPASDTPPPKPDP